MDVMGGVADYSGSLLLQKQINEKACVHIQLREDGWLKLYSQQAKEADLVPIVQLNLHSISNEVQNGNWEKIKRNLKINERNSWHLYISGCFFICIYKRLIDSGGANVYLESDVPIGKGLSSSAAIECATLRSIEKAYNISFPELELPLTAQYVENTIVGAPCGLMDQLTAHFGNNDSLLPIVCQPATIFEKLNIPKNLEFVAIDSGVKHSVAGEAYKKVRTAAFMGYSIIAQHCGTSVENIFRAKESGQWSSLPYKGYLANISRDAFNNEFSELLDEKMHGYDFMLRFKGITDSNTTVDPKAIYRIRECTAHPIFENARITSFYSILKYINEQGGFTPDILLQLGEFMYASHGSYTRCGLGHPETDKIVSLVKNYGPDKGLFGARISGGGSGGTVVALIYGKKGRETIQHLCMEHSFTIL